MKKVVLYAILAIFVVSCGTTKVEKKKDDKKEFEMKEKAEKERQELLKKQQEEAEKQKEPQISKDEIIEQFNSIMQKYEIDLNSQSAQPLEYISQLSEINRKIEGVSEIMFNIATLSLILEQYQNSYDYYLKLVKKDPLNKAFTNLAYLGYKLNKISEVIEIYKPLISKLKTDKKVDENLLSNYAVLLIMSQKYSEALVQIRLILSFNQLSIPAYRSLAYLYILTKKYALAEKTINLAISYSQEPTKKASLYVILAKLFETMQESSKMMAAYKQALSLDPYNIDANLVLSILFMKHNAGNQATTYLAKLVEKYPSYVLYRNLYAISLRMAKNFEKSLEEYDKIIAIASNYKDAYYNKGILYQKYMGKPEEAIKAFKEYKKHNGTIDISTNIQHCEQMIKDMKEMENM
ncbi:tetratricopeptide repeat protein [bacterium]|nr:tetratricopeptide repeat protein [bacterium]